MLITNAAITIGIFFCAISISYASRLVVDQIGTYRKIIETYRYNGASVGMKKIINLNFIIGTIAILFCWSLLILNKTRVEVMRIAKF